MVKINKFEFENIKKIKAVAVTPTENGLTIIGGDNAQGKTSVLDSIAWALGGNKYKPSEPNREGSVLPPSLNIRLSNGLVVERSGKNGTLKVTDPDGNKAGQQLLDTFIEQLAIDLPKFMESSNKQKADILLKIIGVDAELAQLELEEQNLYNERLAIGRIADQKKKFAEEQEFYPDAPEDLVSASELIQQQQAILAQNGENQKKRENAQRYSREVEMLKLQYEDIKIKLDTAMQNLQIAETDALDLQDQSTEELEENIRNIEEINRKVRANLDKNKAEEDAKDYLNKYDNLTVEITKIRDAKAALLDNANLPLEGLSVANGELIYKKQKWDNMSSAEQLKVSTAIVRKLNPECGFVLLDKLECMDMKTLKEFGEWLEQEGLQAIATRVSQGDECSIIIEDGYIKETAQDLVQKDEDIAQDIVQDITWKEGVF